MSETQKGTKKPTTVWLESQGSEVKMFFCFNCRIPVLEYTGSVVQIVPGNSPYTPSTILKCKGNVQRRDGTWEACGMYYSFIDVIRTQNPELT